MVNGGARCGGCTLAGLVLRCAPSPSAGRLLCFSLVLVRSPSLRQARTMLLLLLLLMSWWWCCCCCGSANVVIIIIILFALRHFCCCRCYCSCCCCCSLTLKTAWISPLYLRLPVLILTRTKSIPVATGCCTLSNSNLTGRSGSDETDDAATITKLWIPLFDDYLTFPRERRETNPRERSLPLLLLCHLVCSKGHASR